MGKPVEVRVLSRADSDKSERVAPSQSERSLPEDPAAARRWRRIAFDAPELVKTAAEGSRAI